MKKMRKIFAILKVYLVGGSIPERDGDALYNTSTVWCPEGKLLATHRFLSSV